ncbi:hypothetical protein PFISCL1PPCAC_20725, partial [Pristionchus fissidentatus]
QQPPPGGATVDVTVGVQHVYFPDPNSPVAVMVCTLSYTWQDTRLSWNPQDYGGITKLTLPANHKLWKPQLMVNMDGKNHKMSATAHLLKGYELEVKDRNRDSDAYITMYRRVQMELECESESSF